MRRGFKFNKKLKNSQTKKTNGSESMKQSPGDSGTPLLQKNIPSKSLLHQSCETLPYKSFYKINVHGDLSLLVISGNYTHEQLSEVWNKILVEYSQLIKTEKSQSIFEAWKKIEYILAKMKICDQALTFFKNRFYDEEVAEALMLHGFDLVTYDGDNTDFDKQIKLLETQAKSLVVFLNQAYTEYKIIADSAQGESKLERTELDYEEDLAILARFGYKLRRKGTVLEYAANFNSFIKEQQNNRKSNGRK